MAKGGSGGAAQPEKAKYNFGDDLGGGNFIKWDKPLEVIGKLLKVFESDKYPGTFKATVELLEPVAGYEYEVGEQVTFSAPAAMKSRLDKAEEGDILRIAFDGTTTKSAQGRPVKNFTVQIAEPAEA